MGIISTDKGDITFQSKTQALEIIRELERNEKEIWVSGDSKYPCMAICVNGEHAAVTFFQDEDSDMWLSYSEDNTEPVTFTAGGEEWIPDPDAVIGVDDMISCVDEFLNSYQRPECIRWQDL
jgi:hypothetical protein